MVAIEWYEMQDLEKTCEHLHIVMAEMVRTKFHQNMISFGLRSRKDCCITRCIIMPFDKLSYSRPYFLDTDNIRRLPKFLVIRDLAVYNSINYLHLM